MADDPPLDPIAALKAIRTLVELASDDAVGTRLEPIFREIRNVLDNALPPKRQRRTRRTGDPYGQDEA
jgi:hypothetical protein